VTKIHNGSLECYVATERMSLRSGVHDYSIIIIIRCKNGDGGPGREVLFRTARWRLYSNEIGIFFHQYLYAVFKTSLESIVLWFLRRAFYNFPRDLPKKHEMSFPELKNNDECGKHEVPTFRPSRYPICYFIY